LTSSTATPASLTCLTPKPTTLNIAELAGHPMTVDRTLALGRPQSPDELSFPMPTRIGDKTRPASSSTGVIQSPVPLHRRISSPSPYLGQNEFLPNFNDDFFRLLYFSPPIQSDYMESPTPFFMDGPQHSPVLESILFMQPNPIIQSPSLEISDWFPSFVQYRESATHSEYPQPLQSCLEDVLRRYARAIDNYQGQCEFNSMLAHFACQPGCRFCARRGVRDGPRQCLYAQLASHITHLLQRGSLDLTRFEILQCAILHHVLTIDDNPTTTLSLLTRYLVWLLWHQGKFKEALDVSIICVRDTLNTCGPNDHYSQLAKLDLARCYSKLGWTVETESVVKDILRDNNSVCPRVGVAAKSLIT